MKYVGLGKKLGEDGRMLERQKISSEENGKLYKLYFFSEMVAYKSGMKS